MTKNNFNSRIKARIHKLLNLANGTPLGVHHEQELKYYLGEVAELLKRLTDSDVIFFTTEDLQHVCRDCKHCILPRVPSLEEFEELKKIDAIFPPGDIAKCGLFRDVISGQQLYCGEARTKEFCGKKGHFFEPKPRKDKSGGRENERDTPR